MLLRLNSDSCSRFLQQLGEDLSQVAAEPDKACALLLSAPLLRLYSESKPQTSRDLLKLHGAGRSSHLGLKVLEKLKCGVVVTSGPVPKRLARKNLEGLLLSGR